MPLVPSVIRLIPEVPEDRESATPEAGLKVLISFSTVATNTNANSLQVRYPVQMVLPFSSMFFLKKIAVGCFPQSGLGIIIWLLGAVEGQLEVGPEMKS